MLISSSNASSSSMAFPVDRSPGELPVRGCRHVPARPGTGRLWAQVAPASCNGWVALGRREAGAWVINFHGYAISETSLPPAGTVLIAFVTL